jgi:hypothetical protein
METMKRGIDYTTESQTMEPMEQPMDTTESQTTEPMDTTDTTESKITESPQTLH